MTSTSQGRMMSRPKSPSGEGDILVLVHPCLRQGVPVGRSCHCQGKRVEAACPSSQKALQAARTDKPLEREGACHPCPQVHWHLCVD